MPFTYVIFAYHQGYLRIDEKDQKNYLISRGIWIQESALYSAPYPWRLQVNQTIFLDMYDSGSHRTMHYKTSVQVEKYFKEKSH